MAQNEHSLVSMDYFLLINKSSLHANLGKTLERNALLKVRFCFTPSSSKSLSPQDELEKNTFVLSHFGDLQQPDLGGIPRPPDSLADTPPGRMCTLRAKVGSVSGTAGSQCGSAESGSPTLPGSQISSSGL